MTTPTKDSCPLPPPGGFWRRDFLLALVGYFFLFLSVALFYIFPLRLESFGAAKAKVGLIMGIHSILAIGVRPFFGRLIDRKGGRAISIYGLLFFMAVIPFFHLVHDAGWLPLLLRALSGIAWGVSMTASMAVCSDLAPVERLARSIGVIGVAGIVASAAGPALAEEIVRRFGYGGLYNASLAFLAAALACLLLTRTIEPALRDPEKMTAAPLRGYALATLAVAAAMPVFHGAIRGSIVNFAALFARSAGLGRVGPFFAVFSASAILTRIVAGDVSDRYGRKAVILPAAAIIGLNLFWISQVRSSSMFLVNAFLAGFGQGLIFPALSTYIIDIVGLAHKGFGLSLYLALFDVGMGLGSPFFGWVSDRAGYRGMYIVAGILLLLSTAVFGLKAPKVRRAG
ncbi:MAG: MFS transporter [Candidatus Aminicenantes bacterium]|nr:MFS transporter [Candidatus Aminicenantes bacterium]